MKKIKFLSLVVVLVAAVVFPLSVAAQAGGPYTAGFQLQNLEASLATISINYYTQAGTVSTTVADSINANASKTYFPLSAVASGFNGSVVVSSDRQLAAIVNVLKTSFNGGASYGGFTGGATTVNLPLIMKNNAGIISTWFNVQNTGASDANVTVTYSNATTQTGVIPPNAAATFDQTTNASLPDGFVGAATITSDQPIVAVVMQIVTGSEALLAYNGFVNAHTNPVMPLVTSNYYSSGTGIQIQNTGGTATDVTLTYSPSAGFPGAVCTETKNIPGNQSVTFGFPQLPASCGTAGTGVTDTTNGGFVGAAQVTTNSASQPLVAIVNQITRGTATGAAYNAVNPDNASANVSLPLIMDRNVGTLFTGFAVANVGASTTNVACTFSGTGAPPAIPSTALDPGESLTAVQLNAGTAGYVGGATCTATGGDASIAAIVNEAATGVTSAQDLLLVYEGFNY
jgi:hypothetical protein